MQSIFLFPFAPLSLFVLERLPCIRSDVKCLQSFRVWEMSDMRVQIGDSVKMGSFSLTLSSRWLSSMKNEKIWVTRGH